MKISGDYYYGIGLFKANTPDGVGYDWADLAQWERDVWAVRQDFKNAGRDWNLVPMERGAHRLLNFVQQRT